MKIKICLIAACLVAMTGWSQNPKIKKADRLLEARKYREAIALYEEVLEKDDQPALKGKIGDAYRKMRDYTNAETWYSQAVHDPETNPLHFYYYGRMLQQNGKCVEAEQWYRQFVRLRPYDARKKQLQRACAYEEELLQKNTGAYTVQPAAFNAEGADLGPAFYKNGLVFASKRKDPAHKNAADYFDLYFVETSGTAQPQRFSERLNSQYHDGIVTFNANFTEIFFTRSRKNPVTELKEMYPLEILRSQNPNDSAWTALEPLPFNSDDYSVAHPALTPDGKRLFFSSDMPGGFGGRDLYFSENLNGQWSKPVNLGPNINTEGDEVFPWYEGRRLYFASDGQVGLGGMDIFFVTDQGNGDWSEVENLGAPVNSEFDDFGIVIKPQEQSGFFTSNRPGGAGGDDIYHFAQTRAQVIVELVDATTNSALLDVIATQTDDSNIVIKQFDNQLIVNLTGNECGTFSFELKGYTTQTRNICALGEGAQKITVALQKEIPRLIGLTVDQNTGQPVAGAAVKLVAEKCNPLTTTTNADGKYEFNLTEDCCYQIRVEKDQFFTQAGNEVICTRDVSGSLEKTIYLQAFTAPIKTPVATEVKLDFKTEEVKSFQRSAKTYEGGSIAYLINVYYDFGHASVRREALPELEKLLQLLIDNPNLIVEISSHTDSRGDSRYNQKLSQRRADAVATWLIQRGIKKERLVAVGYGETRLINACEIEEDCSEAAHQMNRRTEFRVLGKTK